MTFSGLLVDTWINIVAIHFSCRFSAMKCHANINVDFTEKPVCVFIHLDLVTWIAPWVLFFQVAFLHVFHGIVDMGCWYNHKVHFTGISGLIHLLPFACETYTFCDMEYWSIFRIDLKGFIRCYLLWFSFTSDTIGFGDVACCFTFQCGFGRQMRCYFLT